MPVAWMNPSRALGRRASIACCVLATLCGGSWVQRADGQSSRSEDRLGWFREAKFGRG